MPDLSGGFNSLSPFNNGKITRLVQPSGEHIQGFKLAPKAYTNNFSGGAPSSSMPLDPAAQISLQQAAAARNTYLAQLQQQQQQAQQNYSDQLYDIHQQQPLDTQALRDNFASRGAIFSSGYGNQSNLLTKNYATTLSRLAAARTAAQSGFKLDRSRYNKEYGLNLAAIKQAAADRLSQNASQLGIKGKNNNKAKTLQGNG